MRILSYCVMPNHWHLVVWPRSDGDLSAFGKWLSQTHTQRYQVHRDLTGSGHLYQGRFKSFPVQADGHLLQVCRYVEANARRAHLVHHAEDWPWSSAWQRLRAPVSGVRLVDPWPVPRPENWLTRLNEMTTQEVLQALSQAVCRGRPYGDETWTRDLAQCDGLQSTLRRRGRPNKMPDPFSAAAATAPACLAGD